MSTHPQISLSRPQITDDDIDAVVRVLHSPTLSMGPNLVAFEQAIADLAGARHGIGVNSGTSGLHVCMEAIGVGPGDEVVTTPFSFVASSNCILYSGGTPVFADINPVTLALDPAQVEDAITTRTKAILPVDVFGQPCPIEDIHAIARRRGLRLIEDSCEALGSHRNGIMAGSPIYADAAVYAFYPNKQITTGEGGMVVTDDDDLADVMTSLRNQGRDDAGTWMNHVRLGYNYRLDEMSAALGLSQLSRLPYILERHQQIASMYTERLAEVPGVTVPTLDPATTRMSWFVYVIRLDAGLDRVAVFDHLMANGVPCRPYFVPIHLQPYYRERFGFREGDFPVTEAVARTTMAIPFFTEMTEGEVDYVVDQIRLAVHG